MYIYALRARGGDLALRFDEVGVGNAVVARLDPGFAWFRV